MLIQHVQNLFQIRNFNLSRIQSFEPQKSKALAKATDKTPPPRAVVVSVNMPGMQPGGN